MALGYSLKNLFFIFSSLTIIRAYNITAGYFAYWLSILTGKPIVFGLPFCCSIEPTNLCNLKCPECPTGMNSLKRAIGSLSYVDFKDLISAISSHTSYLTLYLQGEPFLNKDLTEMIKYTSYLGIYTSLSTNGHFLNNSVAQQLISAKLKKIIISLDGANQNSYSDYRRNGNFGKVIDGIKQIIEAREKAGVIYPLVVIQFIVFRTNEHEIPEIKKLSKILKADKIEIKTAQHYDLSESNPLITTIEKYRRYKLNSSGKWELKKQSGKGCKRLWTTAVITWDRKIVPCCYDKDAFFTVGHLVDSSLKHLWKGEKFRLFRSKVLKEKHSVEICNNCGEVFNQ